MSQKGSTLLENIISLGILCIYVVVLLSLFNNFSYQQVIYNNSVKINALIQNTAEELLNKQYTQIAVGTTDDTIDGFDRTITVTENSNIKEIDIKISNSEGEMSLTIEKGLDIN